VEFDGFHLFHRDGFKTLLKEDPENPEFDQLLGRLNKTSTQVGFILCRNIQNADKALERCSRPTQRQGDVVAN
jgi:hypothetical protein